MMRHGLPNLWAATVLTWGVLGLWCLEAAG